MSRVVDTVLIDQETVYAPRDGNDRLLLGLKGSLNEYELDLLNLHKQDEVVWHRPTYATIHRMIVNPAYGKTRASPEFRTSADLNLSTFGSMQQAPKAAAYRQAVGRNGGQGNQQSLKSTWVRQSNKGDWFISPRYGKDSKELAPGL